MSNLVKRSVFGLVYVALLAGMSILHPLAISAVLAIFIFFAVREVYFLLNVGEKCKTVIVFLQLINFFLFTTIVSCFYLSMYDSHNYFAMLTACFSALVAGSLIVAFMFFILFGKVSLSDNFKLFGFSIFYIFIPFSIMSILSFANFENETFNFSYLLFLFVVVWMNDTFAYLIGSAFGKHKLAKNISPNKTVEGFSGGLLFSVSAALIINYYCLNQPIVLIAILSIMIVLFATVGDLFESKLKREAGVKDSGVFIPGHGGILDRIDSLLFAAPVLLLSDIIISVVYEIS